MSQGIKYMHSHSGIERDLNFPKDVVLIDIDYVKKFEALGLKLAPFYHNGVTYYKAPTMLFWRLGGQFKNLTK